MNGGSQILSFTKHITEELERKLTKKCDHVVENKFRQGSGLFFYLHAAYLFNSLFPQENPLFTSLVVHII